MSDFSPSPTKNTPVEIIGRMAGEYRLRRKLGEGGFGAVYEAEHPVLKRRAAVKVLHQAAGRDSEAVRRFISEAQAANQIRSRHIVDIFSFGTLADGRHFYVMDLLEGEPLDRCLAREVRFDVPTALQLLRPIAEALDAAHAAGVVHRDLKPQNIFLTWGPHGETIPKLLDFGMAKLLGDSPIRTLSGTPMGTPLYMSPEQARGEKVDGRSDVYALGVLTHELLTGRLPISGDSTIVVLMAHILQPPPRVSEACPEVPSALDAPLLRMLDKDPAVRPATAGAALEALIEAAEGAGVPVREGMPHVRRPAPDPAPARARADAAAMPPGAAPALEPAPDELDGVGMVGSAPLDLGPASSQAAVQPRRSTEVRWAVLVAMGTLGLVVACAAVYAVAHLIAAHPVAVAPGAVERTGAPAPKVTTPKPGGASTQPASDRAPSAVSSPPAAPTSPAPTPAPLPARASAPTPSPAGPGARRSKKRPEGPLPRTTAIPSDLESPF
jgi:serine/threonine-protein kinase